MKIKKFLAICILAATAISSVFVLPASAAETVESRRAQYEDVAHGATLDSYLNFRYDTSSPNVVTKAYAASTYEGDTSNPITTQAVYMVTEVKAKISNSVTLTRKVMTGTFL